MSDELMNQMISQLQIILIQVETVAARGPLSPEWEAVRTAAARMAALIRGEPMDHLF